MKKILVIKTHAIGDMILATPALRSLRKGYPLADITILIGKWSAPILKNNPNINRCIEFDDDIFFKKKYFKIIQLILKIRSLHFDAVLILHPSPFIHLFALIAGIKRRFGLSRKGKNFFLTDSIEECGAYDYYYPLNFLKLASLMSCKKVEEPQGQYIHPEVYSTSQEKESAKKLLTMLGINDFNNLILIAPGGASNPKDSVYAKIWPMDYYTQLIRFIINDFPQYLILLTGGKNDRAITAKIRENVSQVIDLAGKTNLQDLISLVEISKAVICNDSSVLHIGIAQKRPTIGIFGPTSIKGLVHPQHRKNCIQSSEPCSPCYRYGAFLGCKKNAVCMKLITPEMVFNKVKKAIF